MAENQMLAGPSPLPLEPLIDAYKSTQKRLLVFDYDGTLTPIVNNPEDAVPTKILIESLTKLADAESNIVYIISGRSQVFLDKHFGTIKKLGLSAEHGCYLKKHDTETGEWEDKTAGLDMGWKPQVEAAFGDLEARWPRSWIEKKEVAIVWHYRNSADHNACFKAAKYVKEDLEAMLGMECDLDIMLGKANLEARPRSLNKGSTVKVLMKLLGSDGVGKFVFCAGDDTTDEGKQFSKPSLRSSLTRSSDMFQSVLSQSTSPEHIFTCLVGQEDRPTLARYYVSEPQVLTQCLASLAMIE